MHTIARRLVALAGLTALALGAFTAGYRAAGQQARLSDAVAAAVGRQLAQQMSYKSPFETDAPDHLWALGDDRSVVFVHFDKPYAEATRVIYVG
jgi:hypothetical protein